jgi:undecaprenyl-phosphate 4-deoxy-4-formamido-L-arabinose transferase
VTYLSIVIPVYNESENLRELNARVIAAASTLNKPFEIIYVDDGSHDDSWAVLEELQGQNQGVVRLIGFNRNYGQHMAVLAGFEKVRGQVVVTLDADLQNPPEEIPKLVAKLEEGYDVVAGWRQQRQDSVFRTWPSWVVNKIASRSVGVVMHDYGCMLRAYTREIIEQINQCGESTTFIPALANIYARRTVEIKVDHADRSGGRSKYNLYKLIKLNFDLMTNFSLLPLHLVSLLGIIISFLGVAFGIFLFIRRLIVGPEVEGVFTLFAILFVFVGLQILVTGLLGEYIGRVFREVRHRPRYFVNRIIE